MFKIACSFTLFACFCIWPALTHAAELELKYDEQGILQSLTLPFGGTINYKYGDKGQLVSKTFSRFNRLKIDGTYRLDEADPEDINDPFHYAAIREHFVFNGETNGENKSDLVLSKTFYDYFNDNALADVELNDESEQYRGPIQTFLVLNVLWKKLFDLNWNQEHSLSSDNPETTVQRMEAAESEYRSATKLHLATSKSEVLDSVQTLLKKDIESGITLLQGAIKWLDQQISDRSLPLGMAVLANDQAMYTDEILLNEPPKKNSSLFFWKTDGENELTNESYGRFLYYMSQLNPLFSQFGDTTVLWFDTNADIDDSDTLKKITQDTFFGVAAYHPTFNRSIIVLPLGDRVLREDALSRHGVQFPFLAAKEIYWDDDAFDFLSMIRTRPLDLVRSLIFAHEYGHMVQVLLPEFERFASNMFYMKMLQLFSKGPKGYIDDENLYTLAIETESAISKEVARVREYTASHFALDALMPFAHRFKFRFSDAK